MIISSPSKQSKKVTNAWLLTLKVVSIVAIVDFLIMFSITSSTIPKNLFPYGEQVLEPFLTALITLPILYYFILRPYINARNDAEHSLILAKIETDIAHKENNDILREQKEVLKKEVAKATRQLALSRERYALAAAGSNDGLWDWDLKQDNFYASERWKSIVGLDDQASINPKKWFELIHPDDYDDVQRTMNNHFLGKVDHFECEYRLKHDRGNYVWVLTRGMAVLDEENNPVRFAGSQTDISDQKKIQDQFAHDALHDKLTLLPNRTLFNERLNQSFSRIRRHPEQTFAVLFVDLDNFKHVNDTLGHAAGDELLIRLAFRLKSICRGEDTVARWGGDEFTILVEDIKSIDDIKGYARRLLDSVKEPLMIADQELFVNTSIGIALSSQRYAAPGEVLRDADIAMYRAKESGKGQFVIFEESMHSKTTKRFQLDSQLRRALEREEITMFYQPIMKLKENTLAGFETLMRWNHPQLGFVSPAEFIPIAEENGLIYDLGRYAMEKSFSQLAQWRKKFGDFLFMSVNVSQRQIENHNFVDLLKKCIEQCDLPFNAIKVEMTESLLVTQPKLAKKVLERIQNLNVGLSIDDFGTGYSSLSSIHQYPFSVLKIDQSFVKNMDQNEKSSNMIRSIILIGEALNLDVIIEGLETQAALNKALEYGCQYGQGYLFSRPLNAEDIEKIMPSLLEKKTLFINQ
jgi:diguanylate cyclase (GGDEF)-like protein/PAS domain S-box-containing protein